MTTQQTQTALATIALGSNLASHVGPSEQTILEAMSRVATGIGPITGKSRLFVTPCFPVNAGPDYINTTMIVRTSLTPSKVLTKLHNIEADFGRERVQRWGMRTLDLDLICMNGTIYPDKATFETWRHLDPEAQRTAAPDHLILPHPRLQDRAFVLVPLADIAPDWVHPVLGTTVADMLAALPQADIDAVVPLTDDNSERPPQ